MKYYSLNKQSPLADFREATIRGQAPDKGLYFPERIPVIEPSFFSKIGSIPDDEIAFKVIRPYVQDAIPDDELHRIIAETINLPIPLVPVSENIYSLELYHGPTLAFKDIGARFMSRCLGYFSKERSERVIVLVATSGDTGGAVANGFYDVEGVEVVILYPSGKVSSVQEKQLTTLGKNIHALEVEGSFDDCQKLVKQAFTDSTLTAKLFLTSANSINVARWLPQQFYYFFAFKQWEPKAQPPVVCVPSGNFGNICAGMLAHISGLPVAHFIAACNANAVVPEYLQTQNYHPRRAVSTISNAMDVGDPSNFVRILELFDSNFIKLKSVLDSDSIPDTETRDIIRSIFKSSGYLLDPHGAVGYLALEKWLGRHPGARGIFLETAHPVKFYDVVEAVISSKIPVPESIKNILGKPMIRTKMKSDYHELHNYLIHL